MVLAACNPFGNSDYFLDPGYYKVQEEGGGEVKGPVIDLKGVSKFYGQVMGLNDVTVQFGEGMTGLLGPNGAGKSTIMKMITGQISPSKGRIRVMGKDPWDNPELNIKVGYCPEQDAFFRNMTGLQFVAFNARLCGHSSSKARDLAFDSIRKVNMSKDKDRPVAQYSKGMRQRIKLAQSMVNEPDLLILDEPLAGTDPIGRLRIIELLFDLVREGKHLVISSHVLHEVERLTNRIVLIDRGKLVAEGDIHSIRDSLDRYPLTVRIKSSGARKLARLLTGYREVSSITFGVERELLVRTQDPNLFYENLQKLVVRKRISVESIDSPDDNLNAVFEYLVE
jgi:ABC-2 type transport system ATP-binding protein